MNEYLHRQNLSAAMLAVLRGELNALEDVLGELRAERLRQLAASRSRRRGIEERGSPARDC